MGTLVMAVTIVQAGKCSAASITLVTKGWRRRGLDSRLRSGRKRRRVRILEDSRGDEWGRGDVVSPTRVKVITQLAWLRLPVRHIGLGRRGL